MTEQLLINDIVLKHELQPRAELDQSVIDEYAEKYTEDGHAALPPVHVVFDGFEYFLVDGWHRYSGAVAAGLTVLDAEITQGDFCDAKWIAASANATHGLRRTNADKRKAVAMILNDSAFKSKGVREIARHIGVSHTFVHNMQSERKARAPAKPSPATPEEPPEVSTVDSGLGHNLAQPTQEDEQEMAEAVDRLNRPIEVDAVREAFGRVGEFTELEREISAISRRAKANADDVLFTFAALDQVAEDIRHAARVVKRGQPYAVCPACRGRGCSICRDGGWVPKDVYDKGGVFTESQKRWAEEFNDE